LFYHHYSDDLNYYYYHHHNHLFIIGKLPTVAEYNKYAVEINKTAADTFRYLNFDKLPDFVATSKDVDLGKLIIKRTIILIIYIMMIMISTMSQIMTVDHYFDNTIILYYLQLGSDYESLFKKEVSRLKSL